MVIFWRGWGIIVLFVPFAWIFLLVGLVIAGEYYEPDPAKAAAMVYRMGAAALALSTATLWAVSRYRARVAPGRDQFTLIPMNYWTYG